MVSVLFKINNIQFSYQDPKMYSFIKTHIINFILQNARIEWLIVLDTETVMAVGLPQGGLDPCSITARRLVEHVVVSR